MFWSLVAVLLSRRHQRKHLPKNLAPLLACLTQEQVHGSAAAVPGQGRGEGQNNALEGAWVSHVEISWRRIPCPKVSSGPGLE